MSVNLKELRKKIVDLQGIKKITFAMKLVAASKLKNSRVKVLGAIEYKNVLQEILTKICSKGVSDFLLKQNFQTTHILPKKLPQVIVLLSSDRGLCGPFNSLLFKKVIDFIQLSKEPITFIPIGKKALDFCKKSKFVLENLFLPFQKSSEFELADTIAMQLRKKFLLRQIVSVTIAYNNFASSINQVPTLEQILPIKLDSSSITQVEDANFVLVEPSPEKILSDLTWDFLIHHIFYAFVHNKASENAARMVSMDNATQNVLQMLDKTVLLRNRIRQANITAEINEIGSASESSS